MFRELLSKLIGKLQDENNILIHKASFKNMLKPANINEYISSFPTDIQKIMEQIRAAINKAAPGAEEMISYGMPAFKLNGMLVYFAAYQNHIGFYPMPSGIAAFKKQLSIYKGAKGSVQFPLDKPMPLGLITDIVKFRVRENLQKAKPAIREASKRTRP